MRSVFSLEIKKTSRADERLSDNQLGRVNVGGKHLYINQVTRCS